MNKEKQKLYYLTVLWILVFAVTVFIWTNSMASSEKSDQLSTGIMKIIKDILDPGNSIDSEVFHNAVRKTAHFVEFFVLGFLYMLIKHQIFGRLFGQEITFPLFATLATAVVDEYIQLFCERGSQVSDVVLDFTGAVVGILVAVAIVLLIKKLLKRKKI